MQFRFEKKMVWAGFPKVEQVSSDRLSVGSSERENKESNPKKLDCPYCGKLFNMQRSLHRHIRSIHDQRKYYCKLCNNLEFSSRRGLQAHNEELHRQSRVPCHLCDKTFTTKSSLRLHIEAIHDGVRYKCEYCEKTFGQMGSLRRHHNTIHADIDTEPTLKEGVERVFGTEIENNMESSARPMPAAKVDSSRMSNNNKRVRSVEEQENLGAKKRTKLDGAKSKAPLVTNDTFARKLESYIRNRFPKVEAKESRAIAILASMQRSVQVQ